MLNVKIFYIFLLIMQKSRLFGAEMMILGVFQIFS